MSEKNTSEATATQSPVVEASKGPVLYEMRVYLTEGYKDCRLEASSVSEATRRAMHIWTNPISVTVLQILDHSPQSFLSRYYGSERACVEATH